MPRKNFIGKTNAAVVSAAASASVELLVGAPGDIIRQSCERAYKAVKPGRVVSEIVSPVARQLPWTQRLSAASGRSRSQLVTLNCVVPDVNQFATHGRWAFAEFTDEYQIEVDCQTEVAGHFDKMINRIVVERV